MTLLSSPDWLPAGWTSQSRVQKTGRKITYYMNLDTGEKLFSKDDLIRYTRMGNPQSNDPQTVSRQIWPSDNGHVQDAVRSNEHPDWLPDGWFVELKTYKSGENAGKQYKCYSDPSTGFRFYSKPEVFRYLNNGKQKKPISNQEKSVHSTSQVVIEKYPADDLPPGWIKELKIRKSAHRKRKDPYYTNPACDYVFRSKKDVFHYLETGEISRHAFLPKERKIINQKCTHDEITTLSAAKMNSLENGTEKINNAKANNSGKSWKKKELKLPQRSSKRLAGLDPELVAHEVALQTPSTKHCKIKTNTDKVLVDDATYYLKIGHGMVVSNQASTVATTQSHGKPISTSKMPPCEKAVLGEKPEMIETKKIHDDTSTVQPLFSSDPCLKFVTKKTPTIVVAVKEAANKEIVCAIRANILQEKNLGVTSMGSSGSEKTSIKKKKELNRPCRSSKRLPGLAPELVVNSSSSEPLETATTTVSCYKEATQDVGLASENLADGACQPLDAGPVAGHRSDSSIRTSISCSNKSKEPLQDQIFPADKCQELVTEKMYNEKSKLQFSFPFTDSWSDPCLEFAIKTLTGAIPLEDVVNNELVSAPAANIMQENNVGKTVMQSDSTEKTVPNSSKSRKRKNDKELNLPQQSSKRMAVLTLKKFVDSCSSREAIATAASNHCNKESIQVAGLTSENLANGSCQQHDPEAMTGLRHDSMHGATALHEDLSTKSKEPLQLQTVYADQFHNLDNEKMSIEKSEAQIRFPFVDAGSDTCLEFAVKTLAASIPLEDAAIDDGIVSAPATNILQEKNLGEATNGSSRPVKTSLDSKKSKTKKKELNLPCRSSKRLARLATQLVVNSLSTEQTFTVQERNSFAEEVFQNAGSISEKLVDGACQQLQTEPIMELRHGFRCTAGALNEESSSKTKEKGKEPLQDQTVPTEQCQKPDYKNTYDVKSKPQFLLPFGDSWSDPCLEFAFKTLTGAIAVEDNLAVQDYFQQQLDTSSTKRDGDFALPDFGLPNFFKTDISSHFDTPEKPPLRQQPPANVSLPSGGVVGSQQPCMGGVGNYPAK